MYGYVLLGLGLGLLSLELAADGPVPQVWSVVAGMAILVAMVAAAGLTMAAWIARQREALARDEQRFLRSVGRLAKGYRLFAVGAYAAILFDLHWPSLVLHWVGAVSWLLPSCALVVAPFLLLLVVMWLANYRATRNLHRLLTERAVVVSTAGQWTLPRYLVFAFRQYLLIVLVPMLALITLQDLASNLLGPHAEEPLALIAIPVATLALVVLLSGLWIRRCWRTEPLPDGDLRGRLMAMVRRTGVRLGNILVWRTNQSIVNGCMIGVIGPWRYILMTDALLLRLPPDEVEAVFAHEAGHVRHHHVLFYGVLALGAMSMAAILGDLVKGAMDSFEAGVVASGALALVYWWLGFGYVSRRCELEADLYAVSSPAVELEGGDAAEASSAGVSARAVASFTSGLRRIIRMNGMAEAAGGWRHFSVVRRAAFLESLVSHPEAAQRFRRRMYRLKITALAAAVASLLVAAILGLA